MSTDSHHRTRIEALPSLDETAVVPEEHQETGDAVIERLVATETITPEQADLIRASRDSKTSSATIDKTPEVSLVDTPTGRRMGRRGFLGIGIAAAVAIVGGPIAYSRLSKPHAADTDVPALTPEQQEREALTAVTAMAKVYKPEWNQEGGNSPANIDRLAIVDVINALLHNREVIQEKGDEVAEGLKPSEMTYARLPSGDIVPEVASALKQDLSFYASNKAHQDQNASQPVGSKVLAEDGIQNIGTIGRDVITVEYTYTDSFALNPSGSTPEQAGPLQTEQVKERAYIVMQDLSDPNQDDRDSFKQPGFVISKVEPIQ